MQFLFLALVTSVLGAAPLLMLASETMLPFILTGSISTLVLWLIYYLAVPSFVWPLFGVFGFMVVVLWIISAVIYAVQTEKGRAAIPAIFGVVLFVGVGFNGCGALRSAEYANLIGQVEKREWTRDIQPADPKHIRLVPYELAVWLADKQLGQAAGAIGSQFNVSDEHMTLQMIKGELWYVAPLDFKDFGVWNSAGTAPGYVMVHAEDPLRPPVVKTGEKFVYMPGAYFAKNLERHLWREGYKWQGLTDYTFEIDENGQPWWVVTVYEPTIAWSGYKVKGVVVINPTDGTHKFRKIGEVPNWIDRVVPQSIIADYIRYRGEYTGGWVNSWWGEKDLTKPETPSIIYGADGNPYWVTGVTSGNDKDNAVVGFMYTDVRTGKSVLYHAVGGTDAAVVKAVNNKVQYKRWHATNPVLYNIYGTMAAVVPLLGESHTYQGVAIVNINTMQVAEGDNQYSALREYQKLLAQSGQQITPELARDRATLKGTVIRVASEVKGSGTLYYIYLARVPHIFTGSSELSPKLPLTKEGDTVELEYIASGEDVVPLLKFENPYLTLAATKNQQSLKERVAERKAGVEAEAERRSTQGEVQNMNPEQLRQFKEWQKQQKSR